MKEQVIVKLFAGCPVDASLHYELNHSKVWSEAMIHPKEELILTPYKGKEYLGIYINSPSITVKKLEIVNEEIKLKIRKYCPKYNEKHINLQIFSQVFVR